MLSPRRLGVNDSAKAHVGTKQSLNSAEISSSCNWGVRFRLRFRVGFSKEFSMQQSFRCDVSAETR